MKRSTFALLFTVLISFSCIFASCNAREGIFGGMNTTDTEEGTDYDSLIKELEDKIIELKQDQYISDSKRNEELLRLEQLILELKKEAVPDTDSEETEATDTDTDTDNEKPTGKFLYTSNGSELTVTGYTGDDKILAVPSYIDGIKVTEIADDAFSSDTLESVVLPEGISKIGWFAFRECPSLRYVTIPDSVTSIGYSAFPNNGKNFSIICAPDSFAAKYAESYGLPTMLI